MIFRILTFLAVSLLMPLGVTVPAVADEHGSVTFLGVALDPETQEADQKLREFIRGQQSLHFETRDQEYGAAIHTLVDWDENEQGPMIARVTPYVYVVAEMLGAELDILATYHSKKTGKFTYHSYLVTRKATFSGNDLDGFVKMLREHPTPSQFIYHNKFSTSSYFLPSLYFARHDIFSVPGSTANDRKFITIHAERPEDASGSSSLVRKVKEGQADFAAVWDGTMAKFDQEPDLNFLKLPQGLPNDLLVVTRNSPEELKEGLRESINKLGPQEINIGDFQTWVDFNKTPEARRALASLRWLAKVPPNPVPVKIRKPHADGETIDPRYLEAARQAVRLSGTEFILYDEDFHKQFDVLWTLHQTHDDSLIITSEFIDSELPQQEFHISFKRNDLESLVTRIGSEITNRMHRIRYVWPFDDAAARVLRDVDFNIPEGTHMKGMKITWSDQSSNAYTSDKPFDISVAESGFHSFRLEGEGFPKSADNHFSFDPMGNSAYRVFLVRPKPGGRVLKVATLTLIGLFSLAALFSIKAAFFNRKKGA